MNNHAWAVALLLALPIAALPKSPKPPKPDDPKQQARLFQKKLSKDDQVLHALDRLTFGPRPGDVEAVKKMGLKKWMELQLHSGRIKENPERAPNLNPPESLRMSPSDLVASYPSPHLIRAVAQARQPLPEDPV